MTASTPHESAAARAATYALFAALFDRPLDAAGLAALRAPQMRAGIKDSGVTLSPDFATADADALRERLSIEFSHIFVTPWARSCPMKG